MKSRVSYRKGGEPAAHSNQLTPRHHSKISPMFSRSLNESALNVSNLQEAI